MRVDNHSTSQTAISQNEDVKTGSTGKTADNRSVSTTEAHKQIPEASGDGNAKPETSLAERSVGHGSDIATADDFIAAIKEMKYLNSISDRIESMPVFNSHGIQSGAAKENPATGAGASLLMAFNSLNNMNGERMIAHNPYSLYSSDVTVPKGETTHGARTHLENAYNKIKEMRSLDNELNKFSSVDVALSMTSQQNRATLRPHIEAVFADMDNRLKQ